MATGRRRGRAIIYIALILILLLVLVFAVTRLYPGFGGGPTEPVTAPVAEETAPAAEAPAPQEEAVENIVVTTQDVRRGQVLTDDLLAVVPSDSANFAEGTYFTDKAEAVGAKARYDLKAHTPVNTSLIVETGSTGNILSFEIPAGQVAISIPMSKLSSVSYGLQKGDRVNVIASLLLVDLDTNFQTELPNRTGVVISPGPIGDTQSNVTATWSSPPGYDVAAGGANSYFGRVELEPSTNNPVFVIPSEPQRPRLVSQTLIQDALVVRVGTTNVVEEPDEPEIDAETQPEQPVEEEAPEPVALPDVVTLAVDPQDAVSLNYLMLSGASLNMVLRSAGDATRIDTEAATLQFILDQYRIPNPAKLPYGQSQRIDSFPTNIQPFPEPLDAPVVTEGQ